MEKYDEALKLFSEFLKTNQVSCTNNNCDNTEANIEAIPVGISNRHVHLSKEDLVTLFGEGHELTKIKDLSQPGQFAAKETVTLCGSKGVIENVRVLGPTRSKTQVEVMYADCFKLGAKSHLRQSGDLVGSEKVTLVGTKGSVQIQEGLIVAQRHIHMLPSDANKLNVTDNEIVKVEVQGPRGGIFNEVLIRVSNEAQLEFHVDIEEANALGITSNTEVRICR